MLKNIDKTHFFNFVANGFIHLCGGGGGGMGGGKKGGWTERLYLLTEGWYRNISLLPVLCTDSLDSLAEVLFTE